VALLTKRGGAQASLVAFHLLRLDPKWSVADVNSAWLQRRPAL
jgi:hypothetical protein